MRMTKPHNTLKQKSKPSKTGAALFLLLLLSFVSSYGNSCSPTMAEGENATDGKTTTDREPPTDGKTTTDREPPTDGGKITEGEPAADNKMITDGEPAMDRKPPTDNGKVIDSGNPGDGEKTPPELRAPTVISTVPLLSATGVAIGSSLTITFSQAMDSSTLASAFVLRQGTTAIPGAMTYAGVTATFKPTNPLVSNQTYSASIGIAAKSLSGLALMARHEWSFQTRLATALGPAPVPLGMAGGFVILAKAGIDTIPTSAITGNIGVSPIDATGITGFSLIADSTNVFSTSTQITGKVYAANYAVPTPANMTRAISDMETAYTDAAGRTTPDFTELGAGNISNLTLVPGLYKWGTGVSILSNVTLKGGPNDVWIFQIAGSLTQASATRVILSGGALARNVFWQVFGVTALDTTAHIEGIILTLTKITMATGATINGRLFSQTAITLQACQVTQPAP